MTNVAVPVPTVSNLNFKAGEPALGNGAIVPLAATTPDLGLYAKAGPIPGTGTVHIVIDVTGYFQ